MTSIQTISNKTGISRTTLYNNGFHEMSEADRAKALLKMAADNKTAAEKLLEQSSKLRGMAFVMATELEIVI